MFLTSAIAIILTAPVPKIQKIVPYPIAMGTKWEYICNDNEKDVHLHEIVDSEEQYGVVKISIRETWDDFKAVHSNEWKQGVLSTVSNGVGMFSPPMTIRKDILKTGDSWVEKYEYKAPGVSQTYEFTVTVGEPEEATTPAEKFKTYTLIEKSKDSKIVRKYWYSDELGFVSQEYNNKIIKELKSFSPGSSKQKAVGITLAPR